MFFLHFNKNTIGIGMKNLSIHEPEASPTTTRTKRCVGESLKKIVAAEQKWTCALCTHLLPAQFEVDHVTALYLGGTNERANLQALCPNCHRSKTVEEELAYQARNEQARSLDVWGAQLNLYFETQTAEHAGAGAGAPLPLVTHVLTYFCGWPDNTVAVRLATLGHVADCNCTLFPTALWRATWNAAGAPPPHPERCAAVRTLRLRSSATAVFRSELEARRLRAVKAAARLRPTAAGLPKSRAPRSAPPSPARGDGLASLPNAALFEQFRFTCKP
jgi:hypothetical protein